VQEGWRWIAELLRGAGRAEGEKWERLGELDEDLRQAFPVFAPIRDLHTASAPQSRLECVPRQSHRYSGRTAMVADRTVHEPAPPPDPDSPLLFSMEARPPEVPSALIPLFWAPGWNSAQAVTKFQAEVNGPLEGGDAGRRLLEPGSGPRVPAGVPDAFAPRPGALLAVPLHHVFGSEELSGRAPAIRERAPVPALLLSQADARALGAAPGDPLVLELAGLRVELPLGDFRDLAPGLVGVPVGVRDLPWLALPAWAAVRRR
jgi:NADH-quinone oxidoreductase subunit G